MHQTPSPLDILFCHNNRIKQICKGEPYSTSIIGGDYLSNLVIELPFGTVKNSGIKLGANVGVVQPSEEELKKIIASKTYNFRGF